MNPSHRTAVAIGIALSLAVALALISACEDDGLTTPTQGGSCQDPVTGDVSGTHGHQGARLCRSDLAATNTVSIPLTALEQEHLHTLTLTAQQVHDVYGGLAVQVASSQTSGHSHLVFFQRD